MSNPRPRIGIVGYGYIGSYVYGQLAQRPELGLDIAFVHNRSPGKVAALPSAVVLENLDDFPGRRADLIVELAHPDVTRTHGTAFLAQADYMPLSLTALADAALERALLDTAERCGKRLYVPHGAVVGLEAVAEGRAIWEEVCITMKKSETSLDFSAHPSWEAGAIVAETVLYDGPTRALCPLFPRNVNSHAALALGSLGFDRTRSILVAVPGLEESIIEIEARGEGVELRMRRASPMKGVSGTFTLVSTLASICRAQAPPAGLQIC